MTRHETAPEHGWPGRFFLWTGTLFLAFFILAVLTALLGRGEELAGRELLALLLLLVVLAAGFVVLRDVVRFRRWAWPVVMVLLGIFLGNLLVAVAWADLSFPLRAAAVAGVMAVAGWLRYFWMRRDEFT